jgi:hypothetical protein
MKRLQNVIHRTTELYLTLVCNRNAGTVQQTNMTTMSYLFNDKFNNKQLTGYRFSRLSVRATNGSIVHKAMNRNNLNYAFKYILTIIL